MEINESLSSFKSLEDVHLKATYDIEANGISFEEGETIALFDKIQVAGLTEFKDYVTAHGGFDNRAHVFWENTHELRLNFSQGIFSNLQFGLLNNTNIIKIEEDEPLLITKVEELESDDAGNIKTTFRPVGATFVYDKTTGQKLDWFWLGELIRINTPYTTVIVNYKYNYTGGATIAKIGQQFTNGFLELEGKTRVKDDTSGLVTTGIIKIPRLKLMSGLSIRLGAQANPVVGNFKAVGVPVNSRRDAYVAEFYFLNNDIDSDM